MAAVGHDIVRLQDSQCTDHPRPSKTTLLGILRSPIGWTMYRPGNPISVESPDQQYIPVSNPNDATVCRTDAAASGQGQHRMFCTRVVPTVVAASEFCDPKVVSVADHGFGSRTTQ